MRIVTGPFHPDLEEALVAKVRAFAGSLRRHALAGPLPGLGIVVPSARMREHLRDVLVREKGLSLLGVHLLTFQGLALRMIEEEGGTPPDRAEGFVLEALLRLVATGSEPLAEVARTSGGQGALRGTFGDLREALVPARASKRGRGDEADLLPLYAAYEKARGDRRLAIDADATEAAIPLAGASRFLASLRSLLYYGVYDLTGVQLALLRASARAWPVTLFLPLRRGAPAYAFAEAFLSDLRAGGEVEVVEASAPSGGTLAPLSPIVQRLFEEAPGPAAAPLPRRIEASGPEGELEAAAKEVWRLVEEEGVPLDGIAVVARSLSPYVADLDRVFSRHHLPYRASAAAPAAGHPMLLAALRLASVLGGETSRPEVMGLLSSPWFAASGFVRLGEPLRPDRWDLATRALGIARGEDWAKIGAYAGKDVPLDTRPDGERVPAVEIAPLARALATLRSSAAAFPERGAWPVLVDAFEAALGRHLSLPGDGEEECVLGACIREAIASLRALDGIDPDPDRARFLDALRARLQEIVLPLGDPDRRGVEVLDAMAARGIRFRALVLLGLNERVLPKPVVEDPFLRDDLRERLRERHGVRLPPKSAGHMEERLLLALLLEASAGPVTVVWQRSDVDGRPSVPSWYLEAIGRAGGGWPTTPPGAFPRRAAHRLHGAPLFAPDLFLPREWAFASALAGRDAAPFLGDAAPEYRRILAAGRDLESRDGPLGGRDGMTGPLGAHLARLRERGISPTAIEAYAQCPFRYLMGKILRIEPLDAPEDLDLLSPLEIGTLAHDILKVVLAPGAVAKEIAGLRRTLREAAREVFGAYASGNATGFPVVWIFEQERILSVLGGYLERHGAELLAAGGLRPAFVEEGARVSFPDSVRLPESLRGLSVYGRLDRVDRAASGAPASGAPASCRVVDYKFKGGAKPSPEDKDLVVAARTGKALQPPLYLLLGRAIAGIPVDGGVEFHYLAPEWDPQVPREAVLPGDAWEGETGEAIARVVSSLLEGIAAGRFHIQPSEDRGYCSWCDFASVCRRRHGPTRYRLAADVRAASHLALREKPGKGRGKRSAPEDEEA
ncbi:MAG: PD-(D/E)XK nuclease family protein [Planctomycetes bacterium]|nr:PD-(D/E)XK nuclease family protein [Planctomycetota bacterium]